MVKEKIQFRYKQHINHQSPGMCIFTNWIWNSMTITGDDKNLITGSKDGSVFVEMLISSLKYRFGIQKQCKSFENTKEVMQVRKTKLC